MHVFGFTSTRPQARQSSDQQNSAMRPLGHLRFVDRSARIREDAGSRSHSARFRSIVCIMINCRIEELIARTGEDAIAICRDALLIRRRSHRQPLQA